jgi:hypothetical protein
VSAKAYKQAELAAKAPTLADYVAAFEAWETEFREHPEQFMTDEQMAAIDLLPLAEQRTASFTAILEKVRCVAPAAEG